MTATVTIPSARQPDSVLLFGAFALYCAATTFFYDVLATRSVRSFGEPWGRVLIGAIALGSVLILMSAWMNNKDGLLRFELPGRVLLVGVFAVYSLWQWKISGVAGSAFVIILIALGISSAVRLWQISRFTRAAHNRGA